MPRDVPGIAAPRDTRVGLAVKVDARVEHSVPYVGSCRLFAVAVVWALLLWRRIGSVCEYDGNIVASSKLHFQRRDNSGTACHQEVDGPIYLSLSVALLCFCAW